MAHAKACTFKIPRHESASPRVSFQLTVFSLVCVPQGDSLVYQVQKQLKEFGEKVPEDTKSKVEAKISELEESLKGEDTAKIKVRLFCAFLRLSRVLFLPPSACHAHRIVRTFAVRPSAVTSCHDLAG